MKITILFLALIALGFSVKAQRMALADNKTHGTTAASTSTFPPNFHNKATAPTLKAVDQQSYKPLRRLCPCPNFISGPGAITLQDVSGHSKAGALCVVLPVCLSL